VGRRVALPTHTCNLPALPKRLPPKGRTAALERLAADIVKRFGASAALLLASLIEEAADEEK
jgi:hypothetical protein